MDRAGGDQAEIPDRPPDQAFAETSGTRTGPTKIELIGADGFAAEGPLLEWSRPSDPPIAHGKPLLGLKAQHMSEVRGAIFLQRLIR